MRPTNTRAQRTVRITAGALAIAAPVSAVAGVAGQADAENMLQITPASHHVSYGHELTVRGLAPRSDGGYRLALEFSSAGRPWRTLGHTKVHSNGAFRLRAPLTKTGVVRVVPVAAPAPARASANHAATTAPFTASAVPAPIVASQPEPVAVAAKVTTTTGSLAVIAGQPVELRGTLLPRQRGRIVRLETLARGRWRTLAVARTHDGGHFVLRHVVQAHGRPTVRVSFAGDAANTGVNSAGRKLVSLHPAVASWYDDGGNTACGFHAGDGVASPYLPCGTKLVFAYHGRTVTAVVDDRGPFVPGREFDLNQTTAAALGFAGVDTVWSSL